MSNSFAILVPFVFKREISGSDLSTQFIEKWMDLWAIHGFSFFSMIVGAVVALETQVVASLS